MENTGVTGLHGSTYTIAQIISTKQVAEVLKYHFEHALVSSIQLPATAIQTVLIPTYPQGGT